MIDVFKEVIMKIDRENNFQLIDETLILELYAGYDYLNRKSILLVTDLKVHEIKSTKDINVIVNLENNKSYIFFSLDNTSLSEQFYIFADDLINFSNQSDDDIQCARLYLQRFFMWKSLFSNPSYHIMSFESIKGLIGELIFMRDYLFKEYNISDAVISWLGPDKAKRDFEINNEWYEVKSLSQGAKSVSVSSLEQLDNIIDGKLVVVRLEKSNYNNETSCNLNLMVESIIGLIEDLSVKEIFANKLDNYGYSYNKEYDSYVFNFIGFEFIKINDKSRVIRSKDIPKSITKISYELNISMINDEVK